MDFYERPLPVPACNCPKKQYLLCRQGCYLSERDLLFIEYSIVFDKEVYNKDGTDRVQG